MSRLTVQEIAEREEFTARSMDRLMATARDGRQPTNQGEMTEIVVEGSATKSGHQVSVAFRLKDTEAVIAEMAAGLPCGVCHHNPCTWKHKTDD